VRFLADESCDFAVVTALRGAAYDVTAVAETSTSVDDEVVLAMARADARVLLTEDKDFGLLAYASVHDTAGVVLIRYPANASVETSSISFLRWASASLAPLSCWSLDVLGCRDRGRRGDRHLPVERSPLGRPPTSENHERR
jgi:predicted nuclease of predicted toxin-antitoxin system